MNMLTTSGAPTVSPFAWLSAGAVVAGLTGSVLAEGTCGGSEQPCSVPDGVYYAALPEDPDGAPMVLWLHGYGSSGANAVSNAPFAARFTDPGYALIAPSGQSDIGDPTKLDWGVNDGQTWPRDDVSFLRTVITDATARFGLNPDRVLAAGFSRGGSMVWDLACRAPDAAAGFAAVAGAFWEPMAERCAAPVLLHHTHGFSDGLVPIEGREITFQGYDYVQGNVFKALDIWRRVNGCPGRADSRDIGETLWRLTWTSCESGSLTLQLTSGGHGIPMGWTPLILDWFADVVPGSESNSP